VTYPVHPAATLFPMMDAEALQALADDIREHGQREPVILYRGEVLDGRNRLRACELAAVEPRFVTRTDAEVGDPIAFVLSLNKHRRHMEPPQLATLSVKVSAAYAAEAAERMRATLRVGTVTPASNGPLLAGATQDNNARSLVQAAKQVGAGINATATMAAVLRDAPEVFAAVDSGLITTVTDAKRIAAMPEAQRAEVLVRVAAGEEPRRATLDIKAAEIRSRISAQSSGDPCEPRIHHGDSQEWMRSLPDSSADVLVTDPLYSSDIEDIAAYARAWLPLAWSKVKSTGRGYVFIGSYPHEIAAYLAVCAEHHIPVEQLLIWSYTNTMGPRPKMKYFLNYQTVLYIVGPDAAPLDCELLTELCAAREEYHPARSAERVYQWQKPTEIVESYIRHSTRAGDLVIDPFAGSGTTMVCAAKLGRRSIGCEISSDVVAIAEGRGCVRI
jgi:hypothetical protein